MATNGLPQTRSKFHLMLKRLSFVGVIFCLLSAIFISLPVYAQSGPPPSLPEGNSGIAVLYPHDVGISSDPEVIFFDDFEAYDSASQLWDRWDNVFQMHLTRIATENERVYEGAKALEFRIPQLDGEISNAVVKDLVPKEEVIFVRYYTKFDAEHYSVQSNHNGVGIQANYCCPGVPADGTNKFHVGLENSRTSEAEASPGPTHLYIYHPEQRSQWGDHWFPDGTVMPNTSIPGDFGPYFVPRPNYTPLLDSWHAVELMVKANTPGQQDGRIAFWIDGTLIADYPNVRLRDIDTLDIDRISLSFHINGSTPRENFKWYDNVVIARSYIGPMSAIVDNSPPLVLLTAPISGTMISDFSIVTVSADASDDVGVVGVQFKLSGANLGAEDQSAPYSIAWPSILTDNGVYTLTAVARDASGKQATSAPVAVTVANPPLAERIYLPLSQK